METKTIAKSIGLVGLLALHVLTNTLQVKVYDRKIGKERIALTEKFDSVRYATTKISGIQQTLTVSNANHEVYTFTGRRDGTLQNVSHTASNGYTESYSKYSDKIKPFEQMFKEYQNKIKENR